MPGSVNVTLSIEAHARLKKHKAPGESFSDVVLREVPEPLKTAGEILDYFEANPVPKANPKLLDALLSGRGRRSKRALGSRKRS